MRLTNRRIYAQLSTLSLAAALAACGGGSQRIVDTAPPNATGPAADYPVVIGEPYVVEGVTYTPANTLNYDEVGYAGIDTTLGAGVAGAHRTLPLPSYVEVTSLQSGRTILVRLTERGPMAGRGFLSLSGDAAAQLEMAPGTPVRVRRVNPPEQERAALRSGLRAPERMKTPQGLVNVLRKKLPDATTDTEVTLVAVVPEPLVPTVPDGPVEVAIPPSQSAATETEPEISQSPEPAPSAPEPIAGGFLVQAAAFSTSDRANRSANALGGTVTKAGQYWRVRTGPFATREEAEASLAKVVQAGYTDARILRND